MYPTTGFSTPDRKTPEPFPLNADEIAALKTVQTRRMAEGWHTLAERANMAEFYAPDLAFEMFQASELLYDQLTAMLCRRYIEACYQPDGEDGQTTRRLLGI